eukprot:5904_1
MDSLKIFKDSKLMKSKYINLETEYKVVYPTGAKCREERSLSSSCIGTLPFNSLVTVAEISGRRCRISSPKKGWLSLHTADGQPVIKETIQYQPPILLSAAFCNHVTAIQNM